MAKKKGKGKAKAAKTLEIKGVGAAFGGIPLLGSSPIRWRLADGVDPVTESVDIPIDLLDFFEAKADQHEPQELVIERAEVKGAGGRILPGDKVVVRNVRIITAEPGPNPYIGRLLIGDIRWLFPYFRIWKQYNKRWRAAVRKRGAWALEPNLRQDVSEDQYENWSLNLVTGKPWTALEIIDDIVTNPIAGLARGKLANSLQALERDNDVTGLKSVSTENILIDDDGAGALRRALALLPGVGFFIDYDGKPRLYNKFNARMEFDQVNDLGPPIVDAGLVTTISNSTTRPREVHVLFPRKVEVRFDYDAAPQQHGVARSMMNVVPILDPEFKDDNGNVIAQGEWLTSQTYIEGLTSQAVNIANGRIIKISRHLIDIAMVPWIGAWSLIEATGIDALAEAGIRKYNWSSRFNALKGHYLQTFRLNPAWARAARLIEAKLVGIFDGPTGTRAESPVWINHTVVNSQKAMLVGAAKDVDFNLATAVWDGRPADTPLTRAWPPSPYKVEILDMDAGLIRVTPRADVFANWSTLLPAPIQNSPYYNATDKDKPTIGFDCIFEGNENKIPYIDSSESEINVVLTLVPETPNNIEQFHRIIVKPSDLKAILPDGAKRGLLNAKGPIKEILCKDEVARVLWSDEPHNVDLIHRMFDLPVGGIFAGLQYWGVHSKPVTRAEAAGITLNDPLAKDPTTTFKIGKGADLWQIALAIASQVYSGEQDRLMGSKTGPLRPGIRPAGFLSEVAHTVETDGTMITHIQLPPAAPAFSLESFLEDKTRKVLNKELGS